MNIIDLAKLFAFNAHNNIGHKRKYTNEPYFVHLEEVANILEKEMRLLNRSPFFKPNPVLIAGAFLHDVIEDVTPLNPTYSEYLVYQTFGPEIFSVVHALTDQFTKDKYPDLNRVQRKELELARFLKAHTFVWAIKFADLISNTNNIVDHDPDFARVYLKEKKAILDAYHSHVLYNRHNYNAVLTLNLYEKSVETYRIGIDKLANMV